MSPRCVEPVETRVATKRGVELYVTVGCLKVNGRGSRFERTRRRSISRSESSEA